MEAIPRLGVGDGSVDERFARNVVFTVNRILRCLEAETDTVQGLVRNLATYDTALLDNVPGIAELVGEEKLTPEDPWDPPGGGGIPRFLSHAEQAPQGPLSQEPGAFHVITNPAQPFVMPDGRPLQPCQFFMRREGLRNVLYVSMQIPETEEVVLQPLVVSRRVSDYPIDEVRGVSLGSLSGGGTLPPSGSDGGKPGEHYEQYGWGGVGG